MDEDEHEDQDGEDREYEHGTNMHRRKRILDCRD